MSEASPFQTTPPTTEASRIESLDVLRGFALLGILLLNIIGFGMLSPSYSNPGFDLIGSSALNIGGWLTVELFAEGAMRCLFSILFGAGVVLFTDTKAGWVHYKRTFWLLMFGFVNAYILVWSGDILVVYAVAGALLYLARNRSAKSLFTLAGILILLMSLLHAMVAFGLGEAEKAHQRVVAAEASGDEISKVDQEAAQSWLDFISDFELNDSDVKAEIAARTDSYLSVFSWTAGQNAEVYAFVLPVFLLWDALAMMMLGMALYKDRGVTGHSKSSALYQAYGGGYRTGIVDQWVRDQSSHFKQLRRVCDLRANAADLPSRPYGHGTGVYRLVMSNLPIERAARIHQPTCGGGPDGPHQLPHAVADLRSDLYRSRLWAAGGLAAC